MQRVFRVVETSVLKPVGSKTTGQFNRSVRRFGVLNPILLAEVVDEDGVITLAIVDGHRRVRAAQAARLQKVPAVVLKATTKQDRARLTLMCNYMRSTNFHTESAAITTLATDGDAAAAAARAIGLGPVKMQQLYRKIAAMPEPVRQAMYEHRIPVTAATWVAAWPEGLQQEVVELLSRRRYVNTTMVKDLREWYAERHPEEFGAVAPARAEVPFDEWNDTGLHVVDIPVPPILPEGVPRQEGDASMDAGGDLILAAPREPVAAPGSTAVSSVSEGSGGESVPAIIDGSEAAWTVGDRPVDTSSRVYRSEASFPASPSPAESPAQAPTTRGFAPSMEPIVGGSQPPVGVPSTNTSSASGEPAAVAVVSREPDSAPVAVTASGSASRTTADDRAERKIAFVVRLDATLREFAREGRELGIDRSVWVDRSMRAWDRAEG